MDELGATEAAPASFVCPITQLIMADPVCTADGQTYDRNAIAEWLATHDTSPLTGARLARTDLTANIALRHAIEEWQERHFRTIPPSQLTIQRPAIATSSFKTVYRAELHDPGTAHAVPVAVLEVREGDIAAEVKVLVRLARHPRLVRYIGVCPDGDKRYIVVELAAHGSLADAMEDIEDDLTPAHELVMLQQMCSGMEALAAEGLVHRDLALRNVLLFGFDREDVSAVSVKVSDFGLAVSAYGGTHRTVAAGPRPVRYLPPEALEKGRFSEKADVWAFGVAAWELLTRGRVPYVLLPDDAEVIAHVLQGGRLERPPECADPSYGALWAVLQGCWATRPQDRPTFAQLAVALGQLSTPTPGAAARVHPPVPVNAPGTVPVASVDEAQLFVLRSTGQLVTALWLFENGYSKADCEAVAAVAQRARRAIADATAAATQKSVELEAAIAAVSATEETLATNRNAADAQIDAEVEAAKRALTAALDERAGALRAVVAGVYDRKASALAARSAALRAQQRAHDTIARSGTDALRQGDVAVVECDLQVAELLRAAEAAQVDGDAVPEVDPAMPYSFDLDQIRETCVPALRGFGFAGVQAPALAGYGSPSPVYRVGVGIEENRLRNSGGGPVTLTVDPALPCGLVFDPQSGTITGTPTATADLRAHTVTATNEAGSSTCTLRICVKPKIDTFRGIKTSKFFPPGLQFLEDWTAAYSKPYSHGTTREQLASVPAHARYVFVGAVSPDGNIALAAMGERDEVLRVTDSVEKAHEHNGVHWYFKPGWAFGFSPTEEICLCNADTNDTSRELRLSWHLTGQGGWRAGNAKDLNKSEEWRKLVYWAD